MFWTLIIAVRALPLWKLNLCWCEDILGTATMSALIILTHSASFTLRRAPSSLLRPQPSGSRRSLACFSLPLLSTWSHFCISQGQPAESRKNRTQLNINYISTILQSISGWSVYCLAPRSRVKWFATQFAICEQTSATDSGSVDVICLHIL